MADAVAPPIADLIESIAMPDVSPRDSELGQAEVSALRVLVVDDHPANRQVIEMILGSVGIDPVSAENGALAVEAYKAQSFDAILMDLQMPVMDGFTAISLIRRHERETGAARTPIIVVSANVQDEHLAASAEAGADSHLAKPILAPTLLSALEDALDGAEGASEAERQAV